MSENQPDAIDNFEQRLHQHLEHQQQHCTSRYAEQLFDHLMAACAAQLATVNSFAVLVKFIAADSESIAQFEQLLEAAAARSSENMSRLDDAIAALRSL